MTLAGRKILQILPELNAGGVERTALEITEALTAAGAEPHVASAGGRLSSRISEAGGILHILPLQSKNPLQLWKNRQALIGLINDQNIDLIHARSRAPAWSARGAATATNIPFVTTYHGAYSGKTSLKIYYNSVMASSDIVIANSKFIANHIRNTHKTPDSQLVTIPRGVDMSIFCPDKIDPERLEAMRQHLGATDGKTLFLLPARLTSWKGQGETLLAIAALSAETRAQMRCVLAGDPQGRDNYVAYLNTLISDNGLADCVTILPHISDMPAAVMAADWILAPSQRPEAFGRLAAEASAMGKPVITTAIGGGLETVKHEETGLHIPPQDIAALTNAIKTAIKMPPEIRHQLGQNGHAHIHANFTKTMLQAQTLAVYARLLSPA